MPVNEITYMVRDRRVQRGLTQRQAAAALDIAPNTLSQYETGQREIPHLTLVRMALYYETSIDYLLGLTHNPTPYARKVVAARSGE